MKNITKLSALLLIAGIVLANNTLIAAAAGGSAPLTGADFDFLEKAFGITRVYKCDICHPPVSFKYGGQLTRHKLIHTGENPLTCSTCGKNFTKKGHLTDHKLTHTGEKPYGCGRCDKNFTQKSNLKKHERTHTGEKPYACKGCHATFKQLGQLTVHKRKCISGGGGAGGPMRNKKRADRVAERGPY